ncbi:MAG: DegT/DnrJ/EryC1/StrS family aminotransferase [Armatimonadota bacterium]|nr:DegT/DnrJ/EryC1/StrS family aminotransferase [Armatimonadota bacterium]MDR7443499.1 DegT/DnrJ/EryC1/StrS family aminotransferase [Armatimonadota bacterium]MDR7569338.1 DegT/DnrJ/EryC1/StrS family aminotransferase [Armatimonadota bacterium]MDR7614998.1 DegT/DnrJ/EryC1/StrS family aminotransferase [Armatimonadota bacterium]
MSPHGAVVQHSRPTLDEADVRAVAEVLRSGQIAQGEVTRRFEEAVARFVGVRGGVATSSGTAALHLALVALGVGPGDEVILPSYTCVALLQAARYVGATPKLVDLEPDGYNLSVEEVRRVITRRTRALLIPHMFGFAADIEALRGLEIPVIEDIAQALGTTVRGRPVGSFGDVAVCSFYATKVITTGEGGMVLSNSDLLLRRVREMRDYDGRRRLGVRFNYKITDFQAALGLSQVHKLPALLDRRRRLAVRYAERVRALGLRPPTVRPGTNPIFYRYVVAVPDAAKAREALRAHGVETSPPVFWPLHRYLGLPGFPRTEQAYRTALSIPLYPSLREEEVNRILVALEATFTARERHRWRAYSLPSSAR